MKPLLKNSPLSLSETTHMLYADVDQWSLGCDCPRPGAAAEHQAWTLRLSGATSHLFADFNTPLSLELGLLSGELHSGDTIAQPWQLSLVDTLEEYGIPTLLEGVLTLPEKTWSEVKDHLFLAAQVPGFIVRVRLETREFREKPSEFDPERNFAVISFGFDLHQRKENA